MKTTIRWFAENGMAMLAETGSGHLLTMDGAPEGGGHNLAPRPMEVVLTGTGGCSAYDVVLILKKGRHKVTSCEVVCEAQRAETDPKVFTHIHFHFVVRGEDLKPEVVERAISLSQDKYCSASAMLGATAKLSYDFEIVNTPVV